MIYFTSLVLAAAFAQAPLFEVAAVKPSEPVTDLRADPPRFVTNKGRVEIGHMSLQDLICVAWNVKAYQIQGPEWLAAERFDILARLPANTDPEQVPLMLRALLTDRFGVSTHSENREQAVYALVVGKGGLKIGARKEPLGTPEDPPLTGSRTGWTPFGTMRVTDTAAGSDIAGPGLRGSQKPSGIHVSASRFGLMIDLLSKGIDRPIVDRTGLEGDYEIELDLNYASALSVGGDSPAGPPVSPFFHAVERLGLKLQPRKEEIPMLIIDHIEKIPTAN